MPQAKNVQPFVLNFLYSKSIGGKICILFTNWGKKYAFSPFNKGFKPNTEKIKKKKIGIDPDPEPDPDPDPLSRMRIRIKMKWIRNTRTEMLDNSTTMTEIKGYNNNMSIIKISKT